MTVVDLGERRDAATEAVLRERPSLVLPDPSSLHGPVEFDLETSGLFYDDGARTAAVGVAYRLDTEYIHYHAFPFDQGRAEDKGFTVRFLPDTPTNRKRGVVGLPAGDPEGRWDWDTDYNLPTDEWVTLCKWLQEAGKARGLSNQNLKFDLGMLRAGTRFCKGPDLERYVAWDPMLASPWVWPYVGSNALKDNAARLWGEDEVAEARVVAEALIEVKKRYGITEKRYDLIPWSANGPYVGQDAVLSMRTREAQWLAIDEGAALKYKIDEQLKLLRVLHRMERRGFGPYDVEQSRAIADRIDAKIEELIPTLPFSPPTGAAAAKYFYEDLGIAPWKVEEQPRVVEIVDDTRKAAAPGSKRRKVVNAGAISADISRRMADAGVPYAESWAQITELTIINRMFYRGYANLAGPDGRLRTSFKQAHVRTGRLSVERWQAQALPKKLAKKLDGEILIEPRKLFHVDAGRRRMNLDLSQAELRIAAHFAGCETMTAALLTGADFHSQTTKRVFGRDESDPEWTYMRDIGKRLTFASIFYVGAKRFRATLWDEAAIEWSMAESRQAVNAWRDTYPEFGHAFHYWMEFAERNKYVPLVDNTPSWMAGPRDYPNSAWNRVVQGSLALFTTEWLIAVEKETAKYDALILTVHDSAVLDLPEDVADDVCAKLKTMTEEMWYRRFGIPGKVDVGPWQKS